MGAFFMPPSLAQFMNSKEDLNDTKMDENMSDKQSYHSGSLGKENLNGDCSKYMGMLNN